MLEILEDTATNLVLSVREISHIKSAFIIGFFSLLFFFVASITFFFLPAVSILVLIPAVFLLYAAILGESFRYLSIDRSQNIITIEYINFVRKRTKNIPCQEVTKVLTVLCNNFKYNNFYRNMAITFVLKDKRTVTFRPPFCFSNEDAFALGDKIATLLQVPSSHQQRWIYIPMG